jgi:hypothetical protein
MCWCRACEADQKNDSRKANLSSHAPVSGSAWLQQYIVPTRAEKGATA